MSETHQPVLFPIDAFETSTSAKGLTLKPVIEGQVYLIPGFFSKSVCQLLVEQLSAQKWTFTSDIRVGQACRFNSAEDARRLWKDTGLEQIVLCSKHISMDTICGLSPNIRIYKYRPGESFGPHYDRSEEVESTQPPYGLAETRWTLLVYLTTSEGGQTIFHPSQSFSTSGSLIVEPEPKIAPVSVDPKEGVALLHRHGRSCLLHEGSPVLSGEKWVLRTDICISE